MLRKFEDITPDLYDELNAEIERTFDEGCHGNCASCSGGCASPKFPRFAKRLYAVTGGKGGTGKSTVAALLACALARAGLSVGLLDADVYGSTLPSLLGVSGPVHSTEQDGQKILEPALLPNGVRLLSYGLIAEQPTEPVLWPGQDAASIASYLYTGGAWSGLDVLLLDMPSGAGDIPLNLYTSLPVDGAIIVTEPGPLALNATQRCINLCSMLMSPPIAFVENKALTETPDSSRLYALPACAHAAVPLSPEISVYSSTGKIADLEVPELSAVVTQIVSSVYPKQP